MPGIEVVKALTALREVTEENVGGAILAVEWAGEFLLFLSLIFYGGSLITISPAS